MATYMFLMNYTEKGIAEVKQAPTRVDQARELFKSLGAELKQYYLTMGEYDAMAIIEAPNAEVMAKIALIVGSQGYVRTKTLEAFPEQEYRNIIAALP